MMRTRRISTSRWWNKKQIWKLFLCFVILLFIRSSKSSIFRDIFYLFSKPFWPGNYQREILIKSVDQELNMRLNQVEQDNFRLRKLLELKSISKDNRVNSAVISRNISSWWKQLILNKGSREGVSVGDAVVGPGGLIGIIEDSSYLTSSVKLLTAIDSKVGVWTQRTNIHGLLIGRGNDNPQLVFYMKDIDIKVGDFVLSSPASTLLPPNIPIGIIESVDDQSKPVTTAIVQLIAKPQAIDWVQILKTSF